MQSSLVNFIQVLRSHDVRVSPAETLDAMDVASTLGYTDRTRLRDGLAMALAKTPHEETVFLQCFERYFSHELADFSTEPQNAGDGEGDGRVRVRDEGNEPDSQGGQDRKSVV